MLHKYLHIYKTHICSYKNIRGVESPFEQSGNFYSSKLVVLNRCTATQYAAIFGKHDIKFLRLCDIANKSNVIL